VDFIAKPSASLSGGVALMARELLEKEKEAARIDVSRLGRGETAPGTRRTAIAEGGLTVPATGPRVSCAPCPPFGIVAIGASTGGPVALKMLLRDLPGDFPAGIVVVPTPADKVTLSWGVHNGPQADIVTGSNAYEFPGKVYGSSTHRDVIIDGCVDCHTRLPAGRSNFSADVGGHSFKLSGVVHGELVLNTTGCVSCHRDIRQIPDRDVFNVMAKEDYDINGKKEPVEDEVQGLLNRLVSRTGTGLLQKGPLPVYKPDGSLNITASTTVRPVLEMAALYNYKMISEDRSRGSTTQST
jgi:hypothetical protein